MASNQNLASGPVNVYKNGGTKRLWDLRQDLFERLETACGASDDDKSRVLILSWSIAKSARVHNCEKRPAQAQLYRA